MDTSKTALFALKISFFALLGGCGGGSTGDSPKGTDTEYKFPQLSHIVHLGQSLGSGEDSFPILTTTDTGYGNFQFARGIHTWREGQPEYCRAPWLRPDSEFSMVPITGGEPINGTGETIASGLVDSLRSMLPIKTDTRFLFSFSGIGSKRLRDLDKDHDDTTDVRSTRPTPGGFYKTSIDDVKRAKAQADRRGWTYAVTAITWMQGEKNNDRKISDWTAPLENEEFLATYSNDLIKLKNDWNSDIQAITGQTSRIPLFSYQTWGAISGQAQLLASDKDPEVYIVAPTYYMYPAINSVNSYTKNWGDWIHLTSDSERWLGAQFAKVMKRVLVDKEKWRPLRPIKAWASADRMAVFVQFHVPKRPIVIDNEFMPHSAGAGLFIPGGPSIQSAETSAADTIKLLLKSQLPVGAYDLEYASERGNSIVLQMPKPVLNVRSGAPWPNGNPSFEVVYAGDLRAELAAVKSRGVFYLSNNQPSPSYATAAIRDIYLDADGNTVLRGETGELRNGTNFQKDQLTTLSLASPYGNIRDSDNEASLYKFSSGPRAGESYPMWNWSVAFTGLKILDSN